MDGSCGYDSETILRYMAELNILGSLWSAGICCTSVGVFLANGKQEDGREWAFGRCCWVGMSHREHNTQADGKGKARQLMYERTTASA